ncbi:MAG: helix-turn-helix transcriptional regulator [Phycisphaerales bacterium]
MSQPRFVVTNRIRRLRFDHGEMTQQQLADRVGVSRQTINAIEGGKYSPSLEVAFEIARAFGTPLEQVFQFDPAQPLPPEPAATL